MVLFSMVTTSDISRLLQNASFEAHGSEFKATQPNEIAKEIQTMCQIIPEGTQVYIPHGPGEGFDAVVSLAKAFKENGLDPIPHICARRLKESELTVGLKELQELEIDTVLILGGDVADQDVADYAASMDILETGLLEANGIRTVLYGGHIEGNKLNPGNDGDDWQVLIDKVKATRRKGLNVGVVTQASHNADTILQWKKELQNQFTQAGISEDVPIEIGLAGPASLKQKYDHAKICGIDNPTDMLRKMHLGTALDMIFNSKPDTALATLAGSDAMKDSSIRFSSIGQLTEIWEDYILPAKREEFEIRRTFTGGHSFDFNMS